MTKIKFTWKLGVALVGALVCVSYIVNFVASQGNNRPALFFAWLGLLTALIFYRWHRGVNLPAIIAKEKDAEEKEFEEWAASRRKIEAKQEG